MTQTFVWWAPDLDTPRLYAEVTWADRAWPDEYTDYEYTYSYHGYVVLPQEAAQ
jgi:hypothetical protein